MRMNSYSKKLSVINFFNLLVLERVNSRLHKDLENVKTSCTCGENSEMVSRLQQENDRITSILKRSELNWYLFS